MVSVWEELNVIVTMDGKVQAVDKVTIYVLRQEILTVTKIIN